MRSSLYSNPILTAYHLFLPETALRWVKPKILIIQSTQDKWQKNCIWRPKFNGDCSTDDDTNQSNSTERFNIISEKLDKLQEFKNVKVLAMESQIHGWTRPRKNNSSKSYAMIEARF